jgi:hypothetical protein
VDESNVDAREVGTGAWREAVAALCLGTAAIHFSLAPPQFGDDTGYGVGLIVAAWAAVIAGIALVRRPTREAALAVVAVQAALVAAWIVVHTAGAPFGPASGRASEPGTADTLAMVLGVLALIVAGTLVVGLNQWFAREVVGGVALGCAATIAVIASTAGVISAAQDGASGDAGHDHGGAEAHDPAGTPP